ncbi:MAG: cytochrome c family protein [bacterium]
MKNNKKIIRIGIFASAGLILTASVLILFYFLKTSGGSNLKSFKTKSGRAVFYNLGCVKCHNIKVLNVKGGHIGPDLSDAYSNVKKVYKKDVNDFLKNPTGTMYFALMFNHLNREDREIIVKELKKAQMLVNKDKVNKKGGV